jgi:hypothetical protein
MSLERNAAAMLRWNLMSLTLFAAAFVNNRSCLYRSV